MRGLWGLMLAAMLACAGSVAMAQTLDLSQTGVPVEATAEDGVKAREAALAAGRRTAWNRMLQGAGISGVTVSDTQIDNMVQSIMVEQERTAPTRYSGRITVNFSDRAVRRVLGSKVPAGATVASVDGAVPAPVPLQYAEAMASYSSLQEWNEIRRRLRAATAGMEIRGVAVDLARLRLSMRRSPAEVMPSLAGINAVLVPAPGPGQSEYWQLSLGGG